MEKEKVRILLNKLAEHGIELKDIDTLLRRNEDIVIELLNLKDELFVKGVKVINKYDDMEVLEALNILKKAKYEETYFALINEYLKNNNLSFQGANLINKAPCDFNAKYAYEVLTNETSLKYNVALLGASIINKSKHKFNAKCASRVLKSKVCNQYNHSLMGASMINKSKDVFNAENIAYVLCDPIANQNKFLEDAICELNKSSNYFNANYGALLLMNETVNEYNVTLEGMKVINEAKNETSAMYIYDTLTDDISLKYESALINAHYIAKEMKDDDNMLVNDNIIPGDRSVKREKVRLKKDLNTLIKQVNGMDNDIKVIKFTKRLVKIRERNNFDN